MNRSDFKHARDGRGFSLTELLVCVAIVALLVSILLPSLAGAREAARGATCLSTLRQLGVALHGYAGDHRGVAPPASADALRNLDRWHGSRARQADAFAPRGGALGVYLGEELLDTPGSTPARICPSFAGTLSSLAAARRGFERSCGGYGYNSSFLGSVRARAEGPASGSGVIWMQTTDRVGSPLERFRRPADKLAFADCALEDPSSPVGGIGVIEYSFLEPRYWPDLPGQRPDPSMHFRHGAGSSSPGAANGLRLDGHAAGERRSLRYSSGIYGDPRGDALTGWSGEADDNRLFDYE